MTRRKNPLVSVVIPTYNRREMVLECIDSVLKSTYKNIEIIVGDDASKDGSEAAIKARYGKTKNVKYFNNGKEIQLSATVNKAIRMSRGDLIFILNDDNEIDKNCIKELVHTFALSKRIGVAGALALYYSEPNIIMHAGAVKSAFMRRYIFVHMNEKMHGQIRPGEEVDTYGNAFMFKREAAKEAGLWDLLVPATGEDGDFEARVQKAGYTIVVNPKAKTYHKVKRLTLSEGWESGRINEWRMYNVLRSKVLNEYRYDGVFGKMTFSISLPLYLLYYVMMIQHTDKPLKEKARITSKLFSGLISGIHDALLNRSKIEYLGD